MVFDLEVDAICFLVLSKYQLTNTDAYLPAKKCSSDRILQYYVSKWLHKRYVVFLPAPVRCFK